MRKVDERKLNPPFGYCDSNRHQISLSFLLINIHIKNSEVVECTKHSEWNINNNYYSYYPLLVPTSLDGQ